MANYKTAVTPLLTLTGVTTVLHKAIDVFVSKLNELEGTQRNTSIATDNFHPV